MGYEPSNTAAKIIDGVPVMVEGLNCDPDQAFRCSKIYLDKIKSTTPNQWLLGMWFIKYRFSPLLIVRRPPPPEALESFWGGDKFSDDIVPKVWAMEVPVDGR